jgi:putative Mg2+ transporter-C (MgtC) family protein
MDLDLQQEAEIFLRILLAVLFGGLIGAEREYRSKSAGFRTMILIAVGACLFTLLSVRIGAPASADRIASNIVTGIGFLGAGVIFRGDNQVNGITTAATIWVVAAIGMALGGGYYVVAGSVTLAMLIVLTLLPKLEVIIEKLHQQRTYTVCWQRQWDAESSIENLLRKNRLRYRVMVLSRKGDLITQAWQVEGRTRNHQAFVTELNELPGIESFEV